MAVIRDNAILVADPPAERHAPSDPDENDLVALALAAGALTIVTGDAALLAVTLGQPRILTPRDFRAALDA